MKSLEPSSPKPEPVFPAFSGPRLAREFFTRDAVEVARDLLGKGLVVMRGRRRLLVEIVEVEAYLGPLDPASHAFRGPTPRARLMFEEGGVCYVYLSYGVNYCMNVVTGPKGRGECTAVSTHERAREAVPGFGHRPAV